MNWKGCGRKLSLTELRYYSCICLRRLRKSMEHPSQDSLSPGRDLNLVPAKYEAAMLTTRPRSSVQFVSSWNWSLGGVLMTVYVCMIPYEHSFPNNLTRAIVSMRKLYAYFCSRTHTPVHIVDSVVCIYSITSFSDINT
jgi:hypothetical protein